MLNPFVSALSGQRKRMHQALIVHIEVLELTMRFSLGGADGPRGETISLDLDDYECSHVSAWV